LTIRRDTAFESLKNNPFFAAWHPDVLELFVDHGMHPSPLGGVELKMSGVVEATVFADFWTCDQVFKALPYLDERIDVRWIMPSIEGYVRVAWAGTTILIFFTTELGSSLISMAHLPSDECGVAQQIRATSFSLVLDTW
jgi:hypothetical protein